jgi:hypothetical protein
MGTNSKGCFLGGMGRKSLVFFKTERWEFLFFQGSMFLVVWDGVFIESGWVSFSFFVFFSFVI